MKLSGSVEVEVVDSFTGEIKQHIIKDNLIPDNSLLELLDWNSRSNYFGRRRISISAQETIPTPLNHTLTQILATGYLPSGVSATWNETIAPPFGQLQNRIDPIGVSRDFWTIGLTDLNSNNSHPGGTSTTTYAYVKLDTVCTQGATDFVNVFYRIQFDNAGGQGLTDRTRYRFGRELFTANAGLFPMAVLFSSPIPVTDAINTGINVANQFSPGGLERQAFYFPPSPDGWQTAVKINSHFKWKYTWVLGKTDKIGSLIHTLAQGYDDTGKAFALVRFDNPTEPFQTGFWHSAAAPGPFFDSSFIGTSQGLIQLSGTWSGTVSQLFKINIIASGAVGVATYRLSIASIPHGINNNTWANRRIETAIVWTDYGWDGSAWIAGNTSAKLTHATDADLLFGIKVKFTNAASSPHFTATDFFTQGICLGLLKDNATDTFWQSSWYTRPTQFDTTYVAPIPAGSPSSLILPAATDPNFIRIETDQLEYHNFKIDGAPVLNVYLDTPPGPQEVSLASDGSGTVLFNAADVGKEFDATYTWIKR